MARPDKAAAVAEVVDSFNNAAGAVLTDYRGLTVSALQELRRSLGENANYAVVKNTLAKIAANEVGIEGFDDLLAGPTAIAFINGDVVERSEEHTSELQSLMRISYAVFCLKTKKKPTDSTIKLHEHTKQ